MTATKLTSSFLILDSQATLFLEYFERYPQLRRFKDFHTFGILCENGQYYRWTFKNSEKPRAHLILMKMLKSQNRFKNNLKTRMHSSRMHTAHSSNPPPNPPTCMQPVDEMLRCHLQCMLG